MRFFPKTDRLCDHTFLPELLDYNSAAIDFGANHGQFSRGMIERFGSEFLQRSRSWRYVRREPCERLQLLPVAIGGKDGTARLTCLAGDAPVCFPLVHENRLSTKTASKLSALVHSLNTQLDRVALLKVDIEELRFDMFESTLESDIKRAAQIT
jgi:hypothetical protein